MSISRRRKQKSGRKSRKNEFLPLFKTLYEPQRGGGTIWTTAGSYAVSTVTGSTRGTTCNNAGGQTSYGNDGTNVTSRLYTPATMDIDSVGNLYILQNSGDVRIRRMDPAGNMTSLVKSIGSVQNGAVIVGAYSSSNTGSASIYQCRDLCVDKSTDIVYFSDHSYHQIRMMVGNSRTPTAVSGKPLPAGGANPYPSGGVTSVIAAGKDKSIDGNQDNAYFNHPAACTFDPRYRRLYVSDDVGIRMVDIGYGPDRVGGPGGATRVGPAGNDRAYVSTLCAPVQLNVKSMVTDLSGNLFITMDGLHSIWKIVPPPFGYTVGVNISTYSSDNGASRMLSAYSPSPVTSTLFAGSDGSSGYTDEPRGSDARFNKPLGLACDSKNNIYVADSVNNVVRMITPTGAVCTVAGVQGLSINLTDVPKYGDVVNTMARFSAPIAVAVDATDSIFVLDRGADPNAGCADFSRVRKITRLPPPSAPTTFSLVYTDSISATFTWTGALTGGEPDFPAAFYFLVKTAAVPTDTRVDIHPVASGSTILTVPNQLVQSNRVAASHQQGFYINNSISLPLRQNTTYTSVTLVAYNNTGSNSSPPIITPVVIKAPSTTYTILKCGKVGATGYTNSSALFSQFNSLKGVAVDQANKVYVVDSGNHCIRVISNIGDSSLFFGNAAPGGAPAAGNTLTALSSPSDVRFSYSGAFPLYVADTGNNRILSITDKGVATVVAITSATPTTLVLDSPASIAIDPDGNFYVTSTAKHCIYKITPQGALSLFGGIVGTAGSTDGPGAADVFNAPTGIIYDAYSRCLYVADTGNHLIRKIGFDPANTVVTLAGSQGLTGTTNGLGSVARFNSPTELAVDAEGNVYVTDKSNHCIRKITIAGLVSTFSGTAGTAGTTDGTSTPTAYNAITTTVKYNGPFGICRHTDGTLFITDSLNGCVRCISSGPAPTKPTSVTLTAVTKNSATIAWSGDTGATFYAYSISPMSDSIILPTSTASPATFSGLTDSTTYSLSVVVGNASGAVFPDPVKCITQIEPANFVLTVPSTKSMAGIGSVRSVVTANLSWTGATSANVIQYSINPAQTDGRTNGTFPANQISPYTIANLEASKAYTITLTQTINNVPTTPTQTATSYTATSNPVTFTTQTPATTQVFSIAGSGQQTANTNATATPNTAPLSIHIKDMRGLTLDKNGALYVTSGTCIVKMTPPSSSVKNYLFDTTISNPIPILVSPNPVNATNGSTITLSAGNPTTNGTPGNDSGNNIRFYNLSGLSYDPILDCIYVTDAVMHIVSKLTFDAAGTPTIRTVAGIVGQGQFADGGLGTNKIQQPKGTCTGPDGSLFIADYGNDKVRRLFGGNLTTISDETFAGSAPSDVTVWPDGSVFVTCSAHHCIRRLVPSTTTPVTYTSSVYAGTSGSSGTDDGALTRAKFKYPQGITSDKNYNIYILDSQNYRVRQITGGNVLTIAGSGAGNVNGTGSVAKFNFTGSDSGQNTYAAIQADNFGNVYLTDFRNGVVRALTTSGPTITEQQLNNYRSSAAVMFRESSAQQQRASSALIEGLKTSSAVQQADSSARRQRDSSAVQQRASSAVQQVASSAQQQVASSAQQQANSSARQQRDSSAVQQQASSATLQAALSAPVSAKDGIVATIKTIQADITAKAAIVYSQTSSQADKETAKAALGPQFEALNTALSQLATPSADVFRIAPNYQDRATQKAVAEPYLQSTGLMKLYDFMRKGYIVIDSQGYIVPNTVQPDKRPRKQGVASTVLPTDIELVGDLTIPSDSQWKCYFDTVDRRYFYVNSSLQKQQYEHPNPPVISNTHTVITDTSTKFLPAGWLKLQSLTPNMPYYFNSESTELTWAHPAPPPNPATLQKNQDATLNPPYEKYTDSRTGSPFYVHSITREAQWNFPDLAFNAGPSTAIRDSSAQQQRASSSQQQQVSSALQQVASSAVQQQASSATLEAALVGPVSIKDGILRNLKPIQTDIAAKAAIVYSQTASQADKEAAKAALAPQLAALNTALSELATTSASIFSIAPKYQDRAAQKAISNPYLQSFELMKLYDFMRKGYVVIDSKGNIVANIELPDKRPRKQGVASTVLPTDIELVGDLTIPSDSQWKSYFDSMDRRYFYVNSSLQTQQYDHPNPPIPLSTHTLITDTSTNFLPAGWIKLQSLTPNMPYYFNSESMEVSWVHPAPPPKPTAAQRAQDATLNPPYEKYVDPRTGSPFYVHAITQEAQWNFPDLAFNAGPSTAMRASSAREQTVSSARQQQDSSAQRQRDSSAVQQGVSSALQQVASSAVQQRASSALQQRASSAVQQGVSSALQQVASSARQQTASSAQKQAASSAVQQGVSSAQQQTASSAKQQTASSARQQQAIQQVASSAQRQQASSAQRQAASSAQYQQAIQPHIVLKDTLAQNLVPLRESAADIINIINSPGGDTDANRALLKEKMILIQANQASLIATGTEILSIDPNYQDPQLQSVIADAKLSAHGIRKVYDLLRNKYIYLDVNNKIISESQAMVQAGGASKNRVTRKKSPAKG